MSKDGKDDRPNPEEKPFPDASQAVRDAFKELNESAHGWSPSKEIEKFIKRMAKKLGISERAVIDKAILTLWGMHQPNNPFDPSSAVQKKSGPKLLIVNNSADEEESAVETPPAKKGKPKK